MPTWAPAFAVGLGNDEGLALIALDPAHCDDVQKTDADRARPRRGTVQLPLPHGARLLYTATFVPEPRVTNPAGTKPAHGLTRR